MYDSGLPLPGWTAADSQFHQAIKCKAATLLAVSTGRKDRRSLMDYVSQLTG